MEAEKSFLQQFQEQKEYFKKAIESGRNSGGPLFGDIYESEESEYKGDLCDTDMLRDIAIQFNSKWVGNDRVGTGRD